MPVYRRPHRRRKGVNRPPRLSKKAKNALTAVLILLPVMAFIINADIYFRKLSGEIAVSDASDLIMLQINNAVMARLAEETYGYDYFVSLEKDTDGHVTAIKTNMSRVNLIATEMLHDVISVAENGMLDVTVPLGNLTGVSFLLGRGPDIPLRIIMMTSSFSNFKNELIEAGINQTKHQIILELSVDLDVLVPWQTLSTTVKSEIIIAETVIIGSVPETFVTVE